jgi:putative Mn2+ efflux pump MntP
VIALLLVALALGIDNLAVSVGIGVSGVRGAVRARVAIVFGLFEAGMPLIGLVIGRAVSGELGGAARWVGGGLLAAVGCYQVIEWLRERSSPGEQAAPGSWGTGKLLVSGLALSIDNLIVGFALGAYHVNIGVAALVIGVVSVAMALIGLEVGARVGRALGARGELAGGVVLVAIGAVMATGWL